MARLLYAASTADFTADQASVTNILSVHPTAVLTVWSAATGGVQETDLIKEDGVTAASTVTSDIRGGFRFYGKDNFKGTYWLEGDGFKRYACTPVGVPERVATLEQLVSDLSAAVDALTNIVEGTADDLVAHVDQSTGNPHTEAGMVQGKRIGAGLVPLIIWDAPTEPQASDGAVDGDFRFNTGA